MSSSATPSLAAPLAGLRSGLEPISTILVDRSKLDRSTWSDLAGATHSSSSDEDTSLDGGGSTSPGGEPEAFIESAIASLRSRSTCCFWSASVRSTLLARVSEAC